jgi:urate oxidase
MAGALGWNRYGKSRVRVMKVSRDGARHSVRELAVTIGLEGKFEAAHTQGDNSKVLPTDTMKNTVYALAKEDVIATIESFGLRLARHFLAGATHVERARVEIAESVWQRVEAGGKAHPHTFTRMGPETPTCVVDATRAGETVRSGLRELVILKSAQSGFSGFPRDKFTTLKETDDRIMASSVTAEWAHRSAAEDFKGSRTAIRAAMVEAFAGHESKSVQHTLFAMAEAALAACAEITEITLSMPNKHCLLVDLAPLGMTNENEVFLPIEEPYGLIEATVRRG